MASRKLVETVHEWPNGFSVRSDEAHTVLALTVHESVEEAFVIDIASRFPLAESPKLVWAAARSKFREATYIDTQYASGIVMDFTKAFNFDHSDPVRCLYLTKNPGARNQRFRTGHDSSELAMEIVDFKFDWEGAATTTRRQQPPPPVKKRSRLETSSQLPPEKRKCLIIR